MVCGVDRELAAFCDRRLPPVSDDEDAGCGFDDAVGDGFVVVDFEDSGDFGDESFEEADVTACDAFDRGYCVCGLAPVWWTPNPTPPLPNEGNRYPTSGGLTA